MSEDSSAARPLKLCVVLPAHWSALRGGAEYQAGLLAARLAADYDVLVTYLTTQADPTFQPPGYRIKTFSSNRGLRRYGTFFDVLRLYRALARESPDVIYQQVGCAHTGIAAFYARRAGCKMIWRVANDASFVRAPGEWRRPHRVVERWFLEYGIRNATVILAQTDDQVRMVERGYGRHDAIVVRNFHPLPPEGGGASDASAADPHPAAGVRRTKRIVWIANFKPAKNPLAFVRLAEHFASRADVEFVMVGALQGKSDWNAAMLDAINAVPNLGYRGELDQDEVNALLEQAYLLVNTSHYEGFSNTFIQAWMRRVPVLSLYLDPDSLLDTHGIGICPKTEEGLRAELASLLEDPARVAAMGERAYQWALSNHSERNIETIAALVGARRRGSRDAADTSDEARSTSAARR